MNFHRDYGRRLKESVRIKAPNMTKNCRGLHLPTDTADYPIPRSRVSRKWYATKWQKLYPYTSNIVWNKVYL